MTAADDTIRAAVLDALSAAGVREPDSNASSYVKWMPQSHELPGRYQLVIRFNVTGTMEFDPHWYESGERPGWDRLFAPVRFANIAALVQSVEQFMSNPCRDTAVAAQTRGDR